jgi:hypothetical protein
MAKKEKKWSDPTKGEKIESLRSQIDKILVGMPRAAAQATRRLSDVDRTLSGKLVRLTTKVDRLAKELQETKKKSETRETSHPEGPPAS